jgi:hypothetical protein
MHYASGSSTDINARTIATRKVNPFDRLILVLKAYAWLVRVNRHLTHNKFSRLYDVVRAYPLAKAQVRIREIGEICHAVDLACIWYWKEVLCLQRSAATTCVLRDVGIPAKMVMGVQQTPFRAHAWVEVEGRVVNDKPYMRDLYAVLDIC